MKYTIEGIRSRATVNENGCWEVSSRKPLATVDGKITKLSRVALALVDPDFDINNSKIYACHKCDNDRCVNPSHLFPGTSSDNQKDHWNKVKAGKVKRMAGGQMARTIFGPLNLVKNFKRPRWLAVEEEKEG